MLFTLSHRGYPRLPPPRHVTILNQSTEDVPVGQLRPHPRNPNRGDVDSIRRSIGGIGWYGFVVAQRSTSHILAGEHRWRAAQEEGASTVPTLWLDVDDRKAEAIMMADNQQQRRSHYDERGLRVLLADHLEADYFDALGFDDDEVARMIAGVPAPSLPAQAASTEGRQDSEEQTGESDGLTALFDEVGREPVADGTSGTRTHEDKPEPYNASLTIGEYRCGIPRNAYLAWRDRFRAQHGYDDRSITAAVFDALGIDADPA